jgi:hypothetical protein
MFYTLDSRVRGLWALYAIRKTQHKHKFEFFVSCENCSRGQRTIIYIISEYFGPDLAGVLGRVISRHNT